MLMRNKLTRWIWCLIVGVAVFASCQKRTVEPVAIASEDMCSYCKMAISEKQYAAELIDSEGQVLKFDDIGCLLNFIKKGSINVSGASLFVMDFDQRQWINADGAYYIRSADVTTPMNGGIIAFKDQAKAQEAVGKYHGKLLRFKELLF
jgi:copper chaperone NosL